MPVSRSDSSWQYTLISPSMESQGYVLRFRAAILLVGTVVGLDVPDCGFVNTKTTGCG